mmetsp:Transcript_23200/g.64855  ORF Transcript_23200/g.64855 Transcript_23200/m.64855 type:complete len:206 (-) Transcript_23200:407-1024(-)
MKPHGSRHERSVPLSSSAPTMVSGAVDETAPPAALTGSPMTTLVAHVLPLRSTSTSNVTLRLTTSRSSWPSWTSSTNSGCKCSWWQNRSPWNTAGATMKPHCFFQERISPFSGPCPMKSSGAGSGSVTSSAVARPFWSIATAKLTCCPGTGSAASWRLCRCTKRSPGNLAGHTRKPQSPFQFRISPRSVVPTKCCSLSALARVCG